MRLAQAILLCLYAGLPIITGGLALHRWIKLGSRQARSAFTGVALAALAISATLSIVFAVAVEARPRIDQILIGSFYFSAVLIVVRAGAAGMEALRRRWFGQTGGLPRRISQIACTLLLALLALPCVMAAAMVWRPKVALTADPRSLYGFDYSAVRFRAADGNPVAGWWIPARRPSDQTVLVAHGLGANKQNQLLMARFLPSDGYNVLAIDLRAHGESGGQFCTFGSDERRDVAAAARWLKETHPNQSRRIVGMGASLGAAAIVAAAAEPDSALDGLVLYGTFADLGLLARQSVTEKFPFPLNHLGRWVAIPLAGAHCGVNLDDFRPAQLLAAARPIPVAIVHGQDDALIPPYHARQLHDAARGPRRLWLIPGDHNSVIEDDAVARQVMNFVAGNLR